MGVEYDLVSDSAREGYELGKGLWYDREVIQILRSATGLVSCTSVTRLLRFLVDEVDYDIHYAMDVAREVVAFVVAHPDWRLIDDCSSDIWVASDEEVAEERAEDIANGDDPDEFANEFPRYRKVGSRYRR